MTAPAYTTRAEAAAPPKHLLETMCEAAYEAERERTSLPPWRDVLQTYADRVRKGQASALQAAEAAGYRITKPERRAPS